MKYFIILFCLSGCAYDEKCANWSTANITTDYKVKNPMVTPSGIHVSAMYDLDMHVLDRVTNEVVDCLDKTFPNHKLPDKVQREAWCYSDTVRQLDNSCFSVIIPSNWKLSCDGTQQILNDKAPIEGCLAKGLDERDYDRCPCSWRAGIHNRDDGKPVIVTTPSLYVYKDPLLRYLTSCVAPWSSPELAACMQSTTDPLSENRAY